MDKHVILNAFNEINMNLVEYCTELMPENIELATMKTALSGLISTQPELNIITFRECTLAKYRSVIEEKDVSFFVDQKYDNNVKEIGISKIVLEKMDFLRVPVGNMDKANQEVIFGFLHKMTKLSDMYN
jgi:hypothetical protein